MHKQLRKSQFFLLAPYLFSLLSIVCAAQIPSRTDVTATPVPNVGHDYIHAPVETVNPANGSLSIRIGVPVPPGRGFTLPFNFAYDSNGAFYLTTNIANNLYWDTTKTTLSQGGWSYSAPMLSVQRSTFTGQDDNGNNHPCNLLLNFVLQDAAGSRTNLGLSYFSPASWCNQGQEEGPIGSSQEGPLSVVMDTTWYATMVNAVTVTDGDGTVYAFPSHSPQPSPGPCWAPCAPTTYTPTYVTDRNGNGVGITSSASGPALSYTDSVGRTSLNIPTFGANPDSVTVSGLSNPYQVYWTSLQANFSPNLTHVNDGSYTCNAPGQQPSISAIYSIVLPNAQGFTFSYDSTYGLINKITYPTGGYVRYVWGPNSQSELFNGRAEPQSGFYASCDYYYDAPAVAHRYVSFDGVHEVLQQDFSYSTSWGISGNPYDYWSQKKTVVTTHDLVRGTAYSTVYIYGSTGTDYQPNSSGFTPQIPVESTVQYFADTNWQTGTPIRVVNKTWANERMLTQQQTVLDNGMLAETDWTYNGNEMETDRKDYDYGSGGHGNLLRETVIPSYHSFSNHIVDKPDNVKVQNSTGTVLAGVGYQYDANANLLNYQQWLNQTGTSYLQTSHTYDTYGNIISTTDPGNHTTQYSYADSFTDFTPSSNTSAYLTKITYPQTNGVNHIESFSYAYSDGQLMQSVDQNSHPTNYFYNDPLRRLTEVDVPSDSGGTTTGKTISYNDAYPPTITNTQYATPDPNIVSASQYDGLGHVTRTQLTSDPEGADITDTSYDGMGRVYSVTNPYRTGTPSPTDGTTYYAYDALGRTTVVTRQDGNTVQTDYSAFPLVTVTDETLRQRQTISDALGRLTEVIEPNPTTGSLTSGSYPTYYSYDALGNLLSVNQAGDGTGPARTRSFSYDSLSRLLTAQNPETGTTSYGYDADGNMTIKVGPIGGQSFQYDALHRLTWKGGTGTAWVNFSYDESTDWGLTLKNPIGRLTSMAAYFPNQVYYAATDFSYDTMGRATDEWTCLPSNCPGPNHHSTAQYDLAGHLTSLTYPSGRNISEGYNAAGHLLNVNFASFGGTSVNYSYATIPQGSPAQPTTWGYFPHGGNSRMSLGNGTLDATWFSPRLQIGSRVLVAPAGLAGNSLGEWATHSYYFTDAAGHNNGNVVNIGDNLNGARTQNFIYDQLNRLSYASQNDGAFNQTFSPDAWGNLTQSGTASSGGAFNVNNQLSGSTIEPTNTCAQSTSIFCYDLAGDVTWDGANRYAYDAESRITSVSTLAGLSATYTYDADGNRVRKDVGGSDPTEYIYFNGELIAEHDPTTGDWSDYIYANGKRIARTDTSEHRLYVYGWNCTSCSNPYSAFVFVNNGGLNNYTIQSGDQLYVRQEQWTGVRAGLRMNFTDGTDSSSLTDSDGQSMEADTYENQWHERHVDLTPVAGKTINLFAAYVSPATTVNNWNAWFQDVVLVSVDGTVHPVYTREASASLTWQGTAGVNGNWQVQYASWSGIYPDNTTYYHEDHLGTSRLMTSYGGWPVWQGTFLPYGQEWNPQIGVNHYKFTGKERDAESGLDFFGARFYSSTMGRWMSPDWADKPEPVPYADLSDPQSLNLYGYVRNNPMSRFDLNGHCSTGFNWLCNLFQRVDNSVHGLGFHTDAQVEEILHRDNLVLRHQGIDPEKLNNRQVMRAYKLALAAGARPSAAQARAIWERATGKKVPWDEALGRFYDMKHKEAVADGGDPFDPNNLQPQQHGEHIQEHIDNGDFSRWARRAKQISDEPQRPIFDDPFMEGEYVNDAVFAGGMCGMSGDEPCQQ